MDHVIVIQEQEAWEGTLEISSCGGIKVPSHFSPREEENNTPFVFDAVGRVRAKSSQANMQSGLATLGFAHARQALSR